MVSLLWHVRDARAADNWEEGVRALHRAAVNGRGSVAEVAGLLKKQLDVMSRSLADQPLT